MQALDGSIHFSASDLLGHINCRYLTNLDLKVVKGILVKPTIRDPGLDVLIERGRRHEQSYLEHLQKDRGSSYLDRWCRCECDVGGQTLAAIKTGLPTKECLPGLLHLLTSCRLLNRPPPDVRLWHKCEVLTGSGNVCCLG
jgi:hypothetical protein